MCVCPFKMIWKVYFYSTIFFNKFQIFFWRIFQSYLLLLSLKFLFAIYEKINSCFELRSLPQKKSNFFLGDLIFFLRDKSEGTMGEKAMRQVKKYYETFRDKKLFVFWAAWQPFITIYDHQGIMEVLANKNILSKGKVYRFIFPWIGRGLLTSDPPKWQFRRKLLTPAFHFDILHEFIPSMISHSQSFMEKLAENESQFISIQEPLSLFALDVLAETAMGLGPNDLIEYRADYVNAVRTLEKLVPRRFDGVLSQVDMIYNWTANGREVRRALKIVHGFARKAIENRIKYLKNTDQQQQSETINLPKNSTKSNVYTGSNRKKRALIDILIAAHQNKTARPRTTVEDIREEVDTFMFAGHDTTAVSLGWILFILGNNLDIQQRLYDELSSVIDCDGNLDHDAISSHKYLDACVKECLRLVPTVPAISKYTTQDTKICGYDIPAGVSLILYLFFMHRDPKLYPDPLKFNPDRFMDDSERPPFAFVPFSAGPRNCIGQKFAMLEIKIFMTLMISRFSFKSKDKMEDMEYCFEVTTNPVKSLEIEFTKRK
ncbi:cytochrome P450 4C1-like [Brevipalpus obovatus]|uniref:cytochrome P450 4C1-like n=1 Tax=Brevipalpus obovatus TaxID=246614 RepID=UPI003D9FAF75